MATQRVTDADFERWVQQGLITADQREAIQTDLESRPAADAGLTVTTLLYYGGGLLVLVAYSFFLGLQWEDLSSGGRIAISAFSFAFFAGVSQALLRSGRFRLPGELLEVVAVAIVPLLVFSLLDGADIWPEDPGFRATDEAQEEYQFDSALARMVIACATLFVAVGAFLWSCSPYVLVAAVVAFTAFVLDVSFALGPASDDYMWETGQGLIVAAIGGTLIATGVAIHGQTERDYSIWLYVMGLIGLAAGLSWKAFGADAAVWGALWMFVALLVLALSIPLQQRLFAVAGLAAVFAYLAKLVFEVFESTNAALVLVVLGLLILGMGMVYQRYSERFFGER